MNCYEIGLRELTANDAYRFVEGPKTGHLDIQHAAAGSPLGRLEIIRVLLARIKTAVSASSQNACCGVMLPAQ